MLEDEGERARGRVILRELVMVEIVEQRGVLVADVDDGGGGIGEVGGCRLAADDGHGMEREEDRTREEFVFVGTAGVGENRGDGRGHEGASVRARALAAMENKKPGQ